MAQMKFFTVSLVDKIDFRLCSTKAEKKTPLDYV